jgi:hypothetical protein
MEPNNKVILYKANLCSMRWRLGLPHVHSRRLSRTVLLMPSDFELEDLSNKGRVASTPPDASVGRGLRPPTYLGEPKDSESTTAYWAWATSVMFVALQLKYFKGEIILLTPGPSLSAWSCALIFSPRILLLTIGESRHLTPLESFLALHFGLLLAFSAVGLVVNVIHDTMLSPKQTKWIYRQIPFSTPVPERGGPKTHPLIVSVTSFSLLSAFLSYNTSGAGSLPVLYSVCTGVLGAWGLWEVSGFHFCGYHLSLLTPVLGKIIFAGPVPVSRKTGTDKHTSAFIFGNKASASEQKKRWKREQKEKGG